MIAALVTGVLFRSAETRTSKAGKPFVAATIRVKDGDESRFVRIVAFSESAQAELLRLHDGDFFSAQGPLKAEVYEKDGTHRASLDMVANHVLALRQPPKERKPKSAAPATRPRQERLAGSWSAASGDPDDSIPF